jgi:hypothetical protein
MISIPEYSGLVESICQKCHRIDLEDFVSQLDPRNEKRNL